MTDRTDNFNRADSTTSLGTPSDSGSAWLVAGGTWGIASNQGYRVDIGSYAFAYLETSVAEGDVQVTLAVCDNPYDGPLCRFTDDQNWVGVLAGDASNEIYLYKRIAGTYTQLGSTYAGAVAAGDILKLSFSSTAYTVYQNTVSRITATDSSHNTITKHGILSNTGTAGGGRFDTFSFVGAAAAGSLPRPVFVRQSVTRAATR